MPSPTLRFTDVDSQRDLHAALVPVARRHGIVMHNHDFWEWFLVVDGEGLHRVNGHEDNLAVGDLRLIRPRDAHSIIANRGLELINIAFPNDVWHAFVQSMGHGNPCHDLERPPRPPGTALEGQNFEEALHVVKETLHFYTVPTPPWPDRLALWRLFSTLLPLLWSSSPVPDGLRFDAPLWLQKALPQMREEENLRQGVSRLLEFCAVSPTHLARTLQKWCGHSPTDYINELRLHRAAALLRTSRTEIPAIADRCGFANLSYFYRLFKQRYGCTPREYRLNAQRTVAP